MFFNSSFFIKYLLHFNLNNYLIKFLKYLNLVFKNTLILKLNAISKNAKYSLICIEYKAKFET